ncbi:hypothetical protein ACFQUU_28225 [Herbaspirillum sp. GCM10030257]|uniref:hypothetical protein n=1 Tax=Herbaspirillum sp. GCM10030257 TaxID=3273393 RepID=UPI00361A4FA0
MPIPEEFKSWFEELCKECGVPDIVLACEESGMALGEVPFLFADGAIGSEGQLLIQTVLAPLPKQGAAEMMRRMLQTQMLMVGPGCPVFGLEPNTNLILLLTPIDPAQIPPKGAAILLQALAKAAGVWRDVLEQDGPVKVSGHQQKLLQKLKR